MIGLGLRLAINGGREAVIRLVVLAVAVGLGPENRGREFVSTAKRVLESE